MKFIPLSILCELLEINQSDKSSDYIAILNQKNLNSIKFNDEVLSESNWKEILKSLNHPKSQLFFSWVETNKSLFEFLTLKQPTKIYKDTFQHLSHGFSSEFKDFISPYISDEILSNTTVSDIKRIELNASFLCLLNDEYRSKVEIKFVSFFKDLLSSIDDEVKMLSSEKELVKKITPMCSSEIIMILNQLSRSNYAIKIQYVDQLLNVIHFKGCTIRFANWIINQLKNINLNNEHLDKIEQLSDELSNGKIQVKNHFELTKSSNQSRNKKIALIGIIIFAFISISILYFKPFESKNNKILSENSAYEQFTVAERKEIDSILKTIETNQNLGEYQYTFFGESASLYSEHKFKNEKMRKLYTDLILDAELVDKGQIIPFKSYSTQKQKAIFYSNVKKLVKSNKEQKIQFSNNSEFDVLIFVIDNNLDGTLYSKIVFPNETLDFEVNLYDEFLFIPGSKFGPFVSPKVAKDELPSSSYKHHFNQVDFNYVNGIKQVYRLNILNDQPLKINVVGLKGGVFNVEDNSNGLIEI